MGKRIKAVLLDRDGVINLERGHIRSVEEFEVLKGVGEAIAILNREGIKVAVLTNQSGIARGYLTEDGLEEIHLKLRDFLANEKGHLDALFYSPWLNQPELDGGVAQYLCEHPDRKPSPGMIQKALKCFNIETGEVCLVGDSGGDQEAAKRAGVSFFGVASSKVEELSKEAIVFESLLAFVEWLQGREFVV